MKPLRTGMAAVELALIILAAGTASADDKVVTWGFSTDYFSKYVWRGQNIDNSSVLQPAFSASAYGFTGSIWGNLDMTNKSKAAPDNAWEFSEFDWSLDYTTAVPEANWISWSVGTIYYRFPNQPSPINMTTEVYTGFSLTTLPLSPSFKWYRDVEAFKGSYFQFGIGQTFDKIYSFSDSVTCALVLGASYGWGNAAYNDGYFGVNSALSNDLTLSAGLPITVGSWTIKPSLNYSAMLSKKIQEATDKSDNFWVGLGISTTF